MSIRTRKTVAGAVGAVLGLLVASSAFAGAVIQNGAGTIALGVDDLGQLNTNDGNVAVNSGSTGIAYRFADGGFRDATSPGCLCEGWGVSVNGTAAGYANNAAGIGGLVLDSFTSSATTIVSAVHLAALPGITITQTYTPSSTGGSFVDHVVITNTTAAAVTNVKYVRVMDWDVPPTEFREFVTIKGTATTSELELSHDDGFDTSNPLVGTAALTAGTTNVDFENVGPSDHGAYFKFNFGTLAAGASKSFDVFYGAAATRAAVLGEIGAQGIELYSLGSCSATVCPATFFFGFKGVGGVAVEPDPTSVPEPTTLALLGAGLLGLAGMRRRKK